MSRIEITLNLQIYYFNLLLLYGFHVSVNNTDVDILSIWSFQFRNEYCNYYCPVIDWIDPIYYLK